MTSEEKWRVDIDDHGDNSTDLKKKIYIGILCALDTKCVCIWAKTDKTIVIGHEHEVK